ncbi:MAG: 2-oxoacid:acceptor oxidoreductase family protein [Spirochaetales bacterium]|jgi:2-oxoisovalerate ferredoxin oxidoreductase beta subunit|nr:2-oxoacid:acceptor oxidoreductase family protein [Spirochaetales bacterium]
MVKHAKPKSFYDEFVRKGGPGEKNTHYCPGCGHGNVHKLVAEVIDELGIQDKTVFCSPVGCSVFAYYYFDVGNVQCAHGRAPAAGTGVTRSLEDGIVISYQGDGDLAGIGMGSIMHAANRGEHMAVFFVNNAIYGMTGGQMAPTTLVGQKTLTSPFGRSAGGEGFPLTMCEIINTLQAPVFIERVSLANAPRILKAKRAIRQALVNQVEKKGFSFVELLSPCPINWKIEPVQARKWIIDTMEPLFPVKNFRNLEEAPAKYEKPVPVSDADMKKLFNVEKNISVTPKEAHIDEQLVKLAGFGGQGVLSAGVLLANCAIAEKHNTSWLPSYGPEMRGGTANAGVIISDGQIGSPLVDNPTFFIAMNGPSLDSFETDILPGGMALINTSLIERKVERTDIKVLYAPLTEIAQEAGMAAAATVAGITMYALATGVIAIDTIKQVIPLSIKRKSLVEENLRVVDAAAEYFRKNLEKG